MNCSCLCLPPLPVLCREQLTPLWTLKQFWISVREWLTIFSLNPATVLSLSDSLHPSPGHISLHRFLSMLKSPIPHDMAALTCAVCAGLRVGVLTAQPDPVYQPQVLVLKQGVKVSGCPLGVWLHQGNRLFCLHPWGQLCLLHGAVSLVEPRNFMIPVTVPVSKEKVDEQSPQGSVILDFLASFPSCTLKPRNTLITKWSHFE